MVRAPFLRDRLAGGERQGELSLSHGVALYVGAVLGTGLLALPALTVRAAGPAALVAWGALVIVAIPVAATFAALAARYPDAGGPATYARRAFGSKVAGVVGWWFYFGALAGMPAASSFGATYVTAMTGGGTTVTAGISILLVAVIFLVNAMGVTFSARLQLLFASILALLLVTAIIVSVPAADLARLEPFAPHGVGGILVAVSSLVWSFVGWETVSHLAGEFRSPGRDLPRATAFSLAIIGTLYLAVACVTVLSLDRGTSSHSNAPIALLLGNALGTSAKMCAAVVAIVVTLGVLNAFVASMSKLGAALGRDGALPRWLAVGSGAGEVPLRSMAVVALGTAGSFVPAVRNGMEIQPQLLAENACLISVYVVAMFAGVRLLPAKSRSWLLAVLALVLTGAVWAFAGWYLLFPLALALGSLSYQRAANGAHRLFDRR